MPAAFNRQTGELLVLDPSGQWVQPKRARNPQTGEEVYLDGDQWKPVPSQGSPQPTLQQRAQEMFGFKDYAKRGAILPFGVTESGETELALPQFAVDMATSFLLPGHVAQGGQYTPEDVTRFALDYAVPATARPSGAGPSTAAMSRRQFVESAPSTEDLAREGSALFKAARSSGVALKPDTYTNFLAGLESKLVSEGIDPMLHPKATAVMNAMAKRIGDAVDVGDLQTIRRQIGIAANSVAPELADERRIASIMRDSLDDLIDNIAAPDILSGDPAKLAANLNRARSFWSRAKKSEIIEGVIEKARTQASGFENGLRIGFRQLLNNRKLRRGFTSEELKTMRQIVEGTTGTKLLRLLGKLSYGTRGGSNFLGGTIGASAGYAAGGPMGAVIPPTVGYLAQKGADASTRQAAELARALAATGGSLPDSQRRLVESLMRMSFPVAGTAVPQPEETAGR